MAKYYYNGVLLPEIPADVLASYPYVWLGKSASSGNYLFYACKVKWWYKSSNSTFSATSELVIYQADQDEWTYVNKITGGDFPVANFSNLWSNHDIPKGSAAATSIYFYGTYPIPEANECLYNGVRLPAIPVDVLAQYRYWWIYLTNDDVTYRLLGSATRWYLVNESTGMYGVTPIMYKATAESDSFELVRIYTDNRNSGIQKGIVWSNFDVPNGSATATSIYFYGNSPVPVVEEPDVPSRTSGYLIRSGSTLYTVADGALSALAETEISARVFQTYGVDEIPDGALLVSLTDPEALFWQESQDDLPALSLTVTGAPPLPQVITSDPVDLAHESISAIDHVTANASEDVRFSVSFNDGGTWLAHDGTNWFQTTETEPGMLASTMNAITPAQWAEIATLTSCQVRAWIPTATSYVDSVVFHYINP